MVPCSSAQTSQFVQFVVSICGMHCGVRLDLNTGRHRHNFSIIASSQPSSRLRDENLGELRHPHGSDCWVRYGSNNSGQNGGTNDDKGKDCNYLGSGDYSPKKAALYHFPSRRTTVNGFETRATQGQAGLQFALLNNNALLFAPRIVFRFC